MSSVASLREHLVEELNDLLSAEQQLVEALPMLADHATNRDLKTAFRKHLAETRTHERRITKALRQLGERATGGTCEAMAGLLTEGQALMASTDGGALRDAMIITAAQKVEHYEIATYGTVRTYARVLGERGVAALLDQTLREEKAADRKLTAIAEAGINRKASNEWHEQAAASMLEHGAEIVGAAVGSGIKTIRRALPDRRTMNQAMRTVRSTLQAAAADRRPRRRRAGSRARKAR